jgi:hypothetical protein
MTKKRRVSKPRDLTRPQGLRVEVPGRPVFASRVTDDLVVSGFEVG